MPATLLVLDSWPVLEWLKGRQPVAVMFRLLIEEAFAGTKVLAMSRINYGEVLYSVRKDIPAPLVDDALRAFHEIPVQFHSVDDAIVEEAAAIKARYAISYADAFAAALALRLGAPVLTGDKEFRLLGPLGVQLHWVGA